MKKSILILLAVLSLSVLPGAVSFSQQHEMEKPPAKEGQGAAGEQMQGGMMGMMCPMMGTPMAGGMMGGMGGMSGGDTKMMGRMLEMRGEMLVKMGEVMMKHGKMMQKETKK